MLLPDDRLIARIKAAPDEREVTLVVIKKALVSVPRMVGVELLEDVAPAACITSYNHIRSSITPGITRAPTQLS